MPIKMRNFDVVARAYDLPKPTFIIVGAARSGTTALYNWLKEHPSVYMSRIKETNYFANLLQDFQGPGDEGLNRSLLLFRNSDGSFKEKHVAAVRSLDEYLSLFSGSENFLARGEASPSYLYYQNTAKNIWNYMPDCKIIILLRDPVERAISNYKALVNSGRETLDFDLALLMEEKRLKHGWEHFWALKGLGLYYSQVKNYFNVFPKSQIKIWLYDELKDDPKRLYKEVCDFINVDNRFMPKFSYYNISTSYKPIFARTSVGGRKSDILALLGRLLPMKFKSMAYSPLTKIIYSILFNKNVVTHQEMVAYLRDYFREDIIKLQELIPEKKVIHWLDPRF